MNEGLHSALSAYFVHPTAVVEAGANIGEATKIWHNAQIRTGARVGARCIVGKGVYIDFNVSIGDNCKLQNYACVYHGVSIERGVFVGPHVVFVNDAYPRAINPAYQPLSDGDWDVGKTVVSEGAAIGANSTVLTNLTIGKWALIAAGSVVTRSVAPYALIVGCPGRQVGWVCPCGARVRSGRCDRCGPVPADHPAANR